MLKNFPTLYRKAKFTEQKHNLRILLEWLVRFAGPGLVSVRLVTASRKSVKKRYQKEQKLMKEKIVKLGAPIIDNFCGTHIKVTNFREGTIIESLFIQYHFPSWKSNMFKPKVTILTVS